MLKILALAAALAIATPAAARTVVLDVETATLDATITMTTDNAVGANDVQSVDGVVYWRDGQARISGLVADARWTSDNLLLPLEPIFDNAGLLFAARDYTYNLYSVGSTYFLSTDNPIGLYNPGQIAEVQAVPEPSTWLMLGLGFLGLALVSKRRMARAIW